MEKREGKRDWTETVSSNPCAGRRCELTATNREQKQTGEIKIISDKKN
jgi:hypothetical protein